MKQRITNLDFLKIIAATCIVFHHYQQLSGIRFAGLNFFGGSFNVGFLVELYFLMSGFLVVCAESPEQKEIKQFFHRVFRILPGAWLSMIIYLIITAVFYQIYHTYMWNENFDFLQILTSFLFVNQGWGKDFFPAVNNPLWYLDVLILCYAVYYGLKWICAKLHIPVKPVYGCLIVVSLLAKYHNVNYPFFTDMTKRGYVSFFIGVLLFGLLKKLKGYKAWVCVGGWSILSIAAWMSRGISDWYVLALGIFPTVLMLLVFSPQINSKVVTTLGAISFEVYLLHMPVYKLLILLLTIWNKQLPGGFLVMCMFAVTVWGVAALVYRFFERPLAKRIRV